MYSSSYAMCDVSEVHKLCSSGQSLEHSALSYTEDGRCGVATSKHVHRQNLPACLRSNSAVLGGYWPATIPQISSIWSARWQ